MLIVAATLAQAAPENEFIRAQRAADQQQYEQATALLTSWLKSHPQDTRAQYLLARVYSWQQQFQSALTIYDSLLATYPDNSDYLLGKAQVLVWQQTPEAALPILTHARNVAPNYQAVWQLELQVLKSLSTDENSDGSSNRFERLLAQAKQRFPDAPWLSPLSNKPVKHSVTDIDIGTSHHRLNNDQPSWHEYYLGTQHSPSTRHKFYGTARTVDRFGLTDRQLSVGYYHALGNHWFTYIDADVSSSHDILPEWSVQGNAGYRLAGNWNLQSGLQHREYRFVETEIWTLNLAHYWAGFRAGGTLYVTSIDGNTIDQKTETSFLVNIAYYYSNISNTGISFSGGDELEYDGSSSPLVTDVRNLSIFGNHWLLNNKWAITYHIERQKQGNLYIRYGFSLGLRYRL